MSYIRKNKGDKIPRRTKVTSKTRSGRNTFLSKNTNLEIARLEAKREVFEDIDRLEYEKIDNFVCDEKCNNRANKFMKYLQELKKKHLGNEGRS